MPDQITHSEYVQIRIRAMGEIGFFYFIHKDCPMKLVKRYYCRQRLIAIDQVSFFLHRHMIRDEETLAGLKVVDGETILVYRTIE